jgi:hypothetical protein
MYAGAICFTFFIVSTFLICNITILNLGGAERFGKCNDTKSDDSTSSSPSGIKITRLELDSCPMFHKENWKKCVFPRLLAFRSVILSFRSDDCCRYRWLLSNEDEKLDILYDKLPFLRGIWKNSC